MRSPAAIFILLAAILLLEPACDRGAPEHQAAEGRSAAEARQSLPPPTLSPPAPEAKQPPAAPPAQAIPESPKGPITLLPSAEGLPPLPAAAGEGSMAGTQQPPLPAPPAPSAAPLAPLPGGEPSAPAAGQAPSAAGPGAEAARPPAGEAVRAIAAPSLPPETVEKAPAPSPTAYDPKPVMAETDILVILDASGSMSAPLGAAGASKLDMARGALFDIFIEMKQQQADFPRNVAVRAFGAKHPASDGIPDDTDLLAKMGAPDPVAIKGLLDAVKAQGMSPISAALEAGAGDFPAGGDADRVIVLLADGADNAGGDPCAKVAKIEEARKTTIHVIAFDISQDDQRAIECVHQKGDGRLFLARNENELRAALDQAINQDLPYNLKLIAQAGATPLPFDLTVYRAGTQEVVASGQSFGTKLLKLAPGTYDILIECSASPERTRPSKILKGVEILATAKVQQEVNFDLGQLSLAAEGGDGKPAAARFELARAGTAAAAAQVETAGEARSFFLTPGTYDIQAALTEAGADGFALAEKGVEVKAGESIERSFRFQRGTLSIKGVTTQKEAIPFTLQVSKSGRADALVASAAFDAEGGAIPLVPGSYDLLVIGSDPKMAANPRTKVSGVEIKAGEAAEVTAVFEMGLIKLSAVDGQGGKIPALFVIRDHGSQAEVARAASEMGGPVQAPIPPGNYDIVASSLKAVLDPKPSVLVSGVAVAADKPAEQVVKFILGTLRLRGRSAKEQPIQTEFTIYRAGSDEKVSAAPPSSDWMVFDLAPGVYDALAVNAASEGEPKPMIWLRDLKVEDGKATSHEAIYTAGKLKIIGRGPNNRIISCHFKVFRYGSDRELISGETGNDWEVFEIEPGRYYLEAAYHDDAQSVMLKKWINVAIGENEVIEEVLRF